MNIITPPHTKIAQKVAIENNTISKVVFDEARELLRKTKNDEFFFPGSRHKECFAMAHPQVSTKPLKYFVINPKFSKIVEQVGGAIIINPRILSKNRATRKMVKEGCMSFPFRGMKKTKRFLEIQVEYYIIIDENSKIGPTVKKVVLAIKDLTAIIFQHELQHLNGKNIYQK